MQVGRHDRADDAYRKAIAIAKNSARSACPRYPLYLARLAMLVVDGSPREADDLLGECRLALGDAEDIAPEALFSMRIQCAQAMWQQRRFGDAGALVRDAKTQVESGLKVSKDEKRLLTTLDQSLPRLASREILDYCRLPLLAAGLDGHGPCAVAALHSLTQGRVVVFRRVDRLAASDGFDAVRKLCRQKSFVVQMRADTLYRIDMTSTSLDPYLRLEDENGIRLAEDDDSGGNLNARIFFNPPRTGSYRIIATTFPDKETGAFVLTVQH